MSQSPSKRSVSFSSHDNAVNTSAVNVNDIVRSSQRRRRRDEFEDGTDTEDDDVTGEASGNGNGNAGGVQKDQAIPPSKATRTNEMNDVKGVGPSGQMKRAHSFASSQDVSRENSKKKQASQGDKSASNLAAFGFLRQ